MFGFSAKPALLMSVAALATVLAAPAAIAATHVAARSVPSVCYGMEKGGGNADEIPTVTPCVSASARAYYEGAAPVAVAAPKAAATTVARNMTEAGSNPGSEGACVDGYAWRLMPDLATTLPTPCG